MVEAMIWLVVGVCCGLPAAAGQSPGVPGAPGSRQEFVVTVDAARIRSAPSTSGAVVATVERGGVLTVVRDVGDWIEVQLVGTAAGSLSRGYVLKRLGTIRVAAASAPVARPSEAKTASPPPSAPLFEPGTKGSPSSSVPPAQAAPAAIERPAAAASLPANPYMSSRFGVGARVGGTTLGVGASVRYWLAPRVALQLALSEFSAGGSYNAYGVSSSAKARTLQFAPAVIFGFPPHERPGQASWRAYTGGGLNIFRSTSSATASGFGLSETSSDSNISSGIQAFGGVEIFFPSLRRLGVSADLGYYTSSLAYGVELGGLAFSGAAHWYLGAAPTTRGNSVEPRR